MIRTNLIILFSSLVLLAGCSRGGEESALPVAASPETAHTESWRESRMQVGQKVYETACASCHDQGDNGAPVIGDRDAWSGRSDLWTAVLTGHATAGYFEMPEKGGHTELTDEDVSAAVEYMLLKTYPEMPRD